MKRANNCGLCSRESKKGLMIRYLHLYYDTIQVALISPSWSHIITSIYGSGISTEGSETFSSPFYMEVD